MKEPKAIEPAPFIRWAGGKRTLAPMLLSAIPATFDENNSRFFEPFVGGGAVMFALSQKFQNPKLIINDVNPDLVATYRTLQNNLEELVKELRKLSLDVSQEAFLKMRRSSPKNDVMKAARFIFLNKTCFNGLWRVNSKGEFNVPFGRSANPNTVINVLDEELLRINSAYLKKTVIREGSYITAVADAQKDDIVYFDPPYIPLNPTSSFSRYAKDDFVEVDQYALAGVIRGLSARGVKVIFSNSDTPLTREIYGGLLELRQVSVSRSISAKAASRVRVNEVIGVNFPIKGSLIEELPLLVKYKK